MKMRLFRLFIFAATLFSALLLTLGLAPQYGGTHPGRREHRSVGQAPGQPLPRIIEKILFGGLKPAVARAHPAFPEVLPAAAPQPPETAGLLAAGKASRAEEQIITFSTIPLRSTPATTTYVYLPVVIHQPASEFVLRVVERTNFYRAQVGCPALILNQSLSSAAQRHSTDMALHDFVGHIGSDGSTPLQRVQEAGYLNLRQLAENIAAGQPTPEAVVDSWMASAGGHRDNILNCDFQDVGVGYYYLANDTGDKNYHHYWTQVFAEPW